MMEKRTKRDLSEIIWIVICLSLGFCLGILSNIGFSSYPDYGSESVSDIVSFEIRTAYMNVDTKGRFYMTADELVMEEIEEKNEK